MGFRSTTGASQSCWLLSYTNETLNHPVPPEGAIELARKGNDEVPANRNEGDDKPILVSGADNAGDMEGPVDAVPGTLRVTRGSGRTGDQEERQLIFDLAAYLWDSTEQ